MNYQHAPAPRLLSSPEATVVAELLLPDVFKRFTTDRRYWAKVSLTGPYNAKNGIREFPAHWRKIALASKHDRDFALCFMNLSLFYWYYSVFSDTEHVNDTLIKNFPIPSKFNGKAFEKVAKVLDRDPRANAHRKTITRKTGDTTPYR